MCKLFILLDISCQLLCEKENVDLRLKGGDLWPTESMLEESCANISVKLRKLYEKVFIPTSRSDINDAVIFNVTVGMF